MYFKNKIQRLFFWGILIASVFLCCKLGNVEYESRYGDNLVFLVPEAEDLVSVYGSKSNSPAIIVFGGS